MTDETSHDKRGTDFDRWRNQVTGELPGWLRPHLSEPRWSVVMIVAIAIVLQLLLPQDFVLRPHLVIPLLEVAVVVVLFVSNPGRIHARYRWLRWLSIGLIALVAIANAISTVLLIHVILTAGKVSAVKVLASGAAIWITNVIVFGLWYWEFDRGGPVARALVRTHTPDFLFPQMTDPRFDPTFHPTFVDYLYVSFTNATAFSPTDTMPLSRWAKALMSAQSLISLVTVGLVAARAVNILPTG